MCKGINNLHDRYRSEKAWVQIKEGTFLCVQIRESVGTDQRT